MVKQSKHPSNCENAVGHECKCNYCFGTMHGWPGAVEIAVDPSAERRTEKRASARSWWRSAFKKTKKRRARANLQQKGAAVDLGRSDIIDWMAQEHQSRESKNCEPSLPTASPIASDAPPTADTGLHALAGGWPVEPNRPPIRGAGAEAPPVDERFNSPSSTGVPVYSDPRAAVLEEPLPQQVKRLGEMLAEDLLPSVQQEMSDNTEFDQLKSAGLDHLWCDILAHLAHCIDTGINAVEGVPSYLTTALAKSRHRRSSLLSEKLIELVANNLWAKIIQLVPIVGQLRELLPAIRVLAVMICKAPERHEEVTRYCLDPLVKELSQESLRSLVAVLRDWLPQCVARAEGEGVPQLPLH